jgi:hypothetical protein
LSTHDWFALYEEASVDAAFERLHVALTQAIDLAVPSMHIKKHKCPPWFSGKLQFYIKNIL